LLGCSPSVRNLDSRGKNIICFGDSITYGVDAQEGEDYPSVLSGMLKRKVINAGLSGDTTEGALARIDKDVLRKDPYLVIIEFGGDDFLDKVPLIPNNANRIIWVKDTLNNLERIVACIQKKGAIAAVCDTSVDCFMRGYRKYFENIARKKKAIFVPGILADIFNNPGLKYDYIHPNKKGYRIIAKKIYQAIKPYVH